MALDNALDEEVIDMTELAAAIAELGGEAPPSGRVTVPESMFPFSARIKEAANAKPGDQMKDGTFYLGCFTSPDGTEKHWFAAAEDAKDGSGQRLCLPFNEAAQFSEESEAHGYNDWIMPPGFFDNNGEPDILNAIFNNKAKIAKEEINGFDGIGSSPAGWYWSSSRGISDDIVRGLRFLDGNKANGDKTDRHPFRLVRCMNA